MTCPRHTVQAKHPNSNVCLVCGDGGSLVCCDGCPAAYHTTCIKDMLQFTGALLAQRQSCHRLSRCLCGCHAGVPGDESKEWHCHDCVGGTKPMVGDVVWVKVG